MAPRATWASGTSAKIGAVYSNGPLSQPSPWGRPVPRWSAAGHGPDGAVSIAGLPASSAWVWTPAMVAERPHSRVGDVLTVAVAVESAVRSLAGGEVSAF